MKNTKIKLHTLLLAVIATTTLFVVGCKKDEETEQENITKVVVHLTGTGASSFSQEFEATDPDGDGIWNVIPSLDIPANTVFEAHLHVYDETKNPVEDLTEEIQSENKVHLFEFKPAVIGLVINNLNKDNANLPFGLESTWTTGAAATGTVQIRLHHEPTDKNAADPGGEIDFDVTFPVKVQ